MMGASSWVASVEMRWTTVVVVLRLGEPGFGETSRRVEAEVSAEALWPCSVVVAGRTGRNSVSGSAVDCSLAGGLSGAEPGPAEMI